MRMRYSHIALVLVMFLVAAIVVGAGCGTKSAENGNKTTSPPVDQASVVVFFIQGETVFQRVERSVSTPGPEEALKELLKGPTADEEQQGLSTAIPEATSLLGYEEEGGRATADFSEELASFGGGSAIVQAITNQVNNTVMANDPTVKSVSITVDGVPASEALQP